MRPSTRQARLFSQCILNLPDPGKGIDPATWLLQAVSELRLLLPFDSGWWGQVEADRPQGRVRNLMHGSLGLSASFAAEWNRVAQSDDFARTSMEHLGKAIRYNHSTDDADPKTEAVDAFARRHGLYHCLAVTLGFRSSGLLFFLSVYRNPRQPAFTPMDAFWLEQYSAHLLKGWIQCLRHVNQGRFRNHWERAALANSAGRLLYIGKQLGQALGEHYQDWQGTDLPSLLMDSLAAPLGPPRRRDRSGLTVQPCGELAALTLSQREEWMPSPRELNAALLYAQGQSHKEVARALGVTPATVRTYLRQVYGQLRVRNKVALAAALQHAGYEMVDAGPPSSASGGMDNARQHAGPYQA